MRACIPCHPESPEDLKSQVIALQNRNVSMLIDTGYSVAANAKLFEIVQSRIDTSTPEFAGELERAAGYYRQAFYRVAYVGAENSMGFHNPSEGGRILRDAMAYSQRCEAILRELCAANDIAVPDEIDLELGSYLTDRGEKSLGFVGEHLFTDPFATHEALWPENVKALGEVPTHPAARSSTRSD
jgi:nitrite reductase (cytochrome c-552)